MLIRLLTYSLILSSISALACEPKNAEDQILASKKIAKKISSIEKKRGVECKPLQEILSGEFVQAVNLKFTKADYDRKKGSVRRDFTVNYLCKKPNGRSYLEQVNGSATISFLYVTENNSCRFKTLTDVSRVRFI